MSINDKELTKEQFMTMFSGAAENEYLAYTTGFAHGRSYEISKEIKRLKEKLHETKENSGES